MRSNKQHGYKESQDERSSTETTRFEKFQTAFLSNVWLCNNLRNAVAFTPNSSKGLNESKKSIDSIHCSSCSIPGTWLKQDHITEKELCLELN